MKDKQELKSSIVEISNKDDVTKEITMLVHKIDMANGNGLDFKKEFVEKFKATLINKPVVAKYYPLQDDLGHHEPVFDNQGNIIGLETIAIGTMHDVWIDEYEINSETKVDALYAKADLWNYKYPEIISCVEKLYNDGNADSSVEVEIYEYGENPTQQYRYATNYTYIGNCLLGASVIPADSNAGVISVAQKEIAMAVKKDLNSLGKKGDGKVSQKNTKETFNKGFETIFKGNKKELNDMTVWDLREKIYNIINPVNPETEMRDYNYFIREIFISPNYIVFEDWDDESKLLKAEYHINNGNVTLADEENWQQVELTYQPIGTEISQLLLDKENEVTELNNKISTYKEEKETMSKELETKVEELNEKIDNLSKELNDANELVVSEQEGKKELEDKVAELNSTIEDLQTYKDKFETAQKEARQKELSEKYSKILSEKMFKSDEVVKAIEECDEVELNSIVVKEIAEFKKSNPKSKKNEDIEINAARQEDLVTQNKHDYWASPRK